LHDIDMTPISCPTVQTLDQILPDEPLLMMGAGPVPIPAPVAYANSLVINHLGPVMGKVLSQVKDMARYVFQTSTPYILGVAGPGSATMEMAMANLLEPGDRMLAVCNGYFSSRMADMARRVGAVVTEHMVEGTQYADPQTVLQQVRALQPKVITLVQGETSNTVWNRYLPEIARGASELGCLVVVDAVCTLSTMPLNMDDWGIDAVLTGGQKGLSSIPGVSLVAFSERAFAAIRQRRAPQTHWCLDAQMAYGFWSEGQYHYTAPTSGILALHEALRLVCLETLEGRFARHLSCSEALQAGIEGLGLSLFVDKSARLNSVVGIRLPDGVDSATLRLCMSAEHKVEISGSFGTPIVRIGQMGEQSRAHHLFRTLHALGSAMRRQGAVIDLPGGMSELERSLSSQP
jgi:alanine-glyoxylate transaminase/serine-glyoxylate transaminase/serine-pyruvate transaminase